MAYPNLDDVKRAQQNSHLIVKKIANINTAGIKFISESTCYY